MFEHFPRWNLLLGLCLCFVGAGIVCLTLTVLSLYTPVLEWGSIHVGLSWIGTLLVLGVLLLSCSRRTRSLSLFGLIFSLLLGSWILPVHMARQGYVRHLRGRLGFPNSGNCTVEELCFRLNAALTASDRHSFIKVRDLREADDPSSQRGVFFPWAAGERVETVIRRLEDIPGTEFTVDVVETGNHQAAAFFPGSIFVVTLKGRFVQPEEFEDDGALDDLE